MTVDQTNWHFEVGGSSALDAIAGIQKARRTLSFPSCWELFLHLSDDTNDDYSPIASLIEDRLEADANFKAWKRARTNLGDLHHFPKYRGSEYDLYHAAAEARANGTATVEQLDLADGLDAEIASSKIIVPVGQVLTHGRANRDLSNLSPYPKVLSSTLQPVVARQSAFRRAGVNKMNGTPVVYILHVGTALPALWGQVGNSSEFELLLPSMLRVSVLRQYRGQNFDVVEAEVTR